MFAKLKRIEKGQALVEFALIIVLLLFIIFAIIESGRLFQGWLTVQNAARDAGRYASTGQFDPACLSATPFACLDPRVFSIKDEARRAASGLVIDDNVRVGEPKSFSVEVWSPNSEGIWIPDDAGVPGSQIRVRVTYRMPLITPLIQAFVDSINLVGQVIVTTETSNQTADASFQSSSGAVGEAGDTGLLPRADLTIDKRIEGENDGVLQDAEFVYILDVVNNGPFNAEGVTIVDQLPAEVTYLGVIPSVRGSTCDPPGADNVVNCIVAPLAGESGPLAREIVRLRVQAPSSPFLGPITNSAQVFPGLPVIDPDTSNNVATATTNVRLPRVDLSVDIFGYPDAELPEVPFPMTIHVENEPAVNPPETATDVVMTATFSGPIDEVDILDPDGATCGFSAQTLTCGISTLNPGQFFEVDLEITSGQIQDPREVIAVLAQVTGNVDEPAALLGNNTDIAEIDISGTIADIAVDKDVVGGPHYAGDTVVYLLTITNKNPNDISGLVLTDDIPDQMVVLEANIEAAGWTCSILDGVVTCSHNGPLLNGEDPAQIRIPVVTNQPGTYTNVAEVVSDSGDPNKFDNRTAKEHVVGAGDLVITKTLVTEGTLLVSQPFTYVIEVANNGPASMDYVVSDLLPVTLEASTWTPNLCPNFPTVADGWCEFDVPIDTSTFYTLTVTPLAAGVLTNTAVVNALATTPDGDPSNNQSEVPTTVDPLVDINITKEAPGFISAGELMTYTLDVVNLSVVHPDDGPFCCSASVVTVTDQLTSSLTFSSTLSDPRCTESGDTPGLITCVIEDLVSGNNRATLPFVVEVDPSVADNTTITNTVTAVAHEAELKLGNNTSTASTLVRRTVDLAISKTAPAEAAAGETLTYTLVITNYGPSDTSAGSVIITDSLPVPLVYNDSASTAWCQLDGADPQLVRCDLAGVFAADSTTTLQIVADIPLTMGTGVISNTAWISSTVEPDIFLDNNNDSAATEIVHRADLVIDKYVEPDPAVAGLPMTYTIVITNEGPSVSTGIILEDNLINGFDRTVVQNPNAVDVQPDSCTFGNGPTKWLLTCRNLVLQPGESFTLTLAGPTPVDETDGFGIYTNSATVTSTLITDPNLENNEDDISVDVDRVYNLQIAKSGPATIYAGQEIVYDITITNTGPSLAGGVVVSDSLPPGLTGPNGVVVGDIPPGTTTVQLTATVDPSLDPQEIVNLAEVISTPSENETDLTDNLSNPVTTTVDVTATLTLLKSDGLTTVVAGDGATHSYVIEVTNDGPSTVKGAQLADTWPGEFLQGSLTWAAGVITCDGGPDFTCNLGDILPGVSRYITVTYSVPSTTPDGPVTNTVSATSVQPALNVSTTDQTVVVTSAEITATKSDGQGDVIAGDGTVYTYTISLVNAGPSTAENVNLADTLPDGLELAGAPVASAGSCSGAGVQPVSCSIGSMDDGASATVEIPYRVLASAVPGTITNTATISWTDTDGANDPDTTAAVDNDTVVVSEATLDLAKFASPNPVIAGEQLTYTLYVTNTGPSYAWNVAVEDILPAGTTYFSGPLVSGVWQVGTLGLSAQSATIVVEVDSGYEGLLSNTASVTSSSTFPGPVTATASVQVDTLAELEITKVANPSSVDAGGGPYSYTLTVRNNGPSDADTVVITDTWPLTFTLVSATTSTGPGCQPLVDDQLVCELGTLTATGSSLVTLEYTVPATATAGSVFNSAVANSDDSPAPVSTGDVEVVVSRTANLSVTKTADSDTVVADPDVSHTFTITVDNLGPSEARNVVVVDTWPLTFTLVSSATSVGPGCDLLPGNQLVCPLGDMLPTDTPAQITLVYTVPATAENQVVVNSVVAGSDDTPAPGNASAQVTVVRDVTLSVTKSASPTDVVAGAGPYSFTIQVENLGPSLASNVVVTDTWPLTFTLVSSSTTAGPGCDKLVGDQLVCPLGNLLPDGSVAEITLEYTVLATAEPGQVTNQADVNAAELGTAIVETATVTVDTSAQLAVDKTDGQDEVLAGGDDTYTYSIVVTNTGDSLARDVVLTESWPVDFVLVSFSSGCNLAGAGFSCDLGDIAPGPAAARTITATYTVPAGAASGSQINAVEVTWEDTDAGTPNSATTSDTTTVVRPDLQVTKTDGEASVSAGASYTFTINVSNAGTFEAAGVILTDTWPVSYTLVSSSTSPGVTCGALVGQQFVCSLGTLAAGAPPLTITVRYDVAASIGDVVTNTVRVSTTTPGDLPAGNQVDDVNDVEAAAIPLYYTTERRRLAALGV